MFTVIFFCFYVELLQSVGSYGRALKLPTTLFPPPHLSNTTSNKVSTSASDTTHLVTLVSCALNE
jgi:hypothetical protein